MKLKLIEFGNASWKDNIFSQVLRLAVVVIQTRAFRPWFCQSVSIHLIYVMSRSDKLLLTLKSNVGHLFPGVPKLCLLDLDLLDLALLCSDELMDVIDVATLPPTVLIADGTKETE